MDGKNHKLKSSKRFSNPLLCFKSDCKPKTRRMNEVTIMDFPRAIMVEILSRLPIKPIFRCKTVCKLWYHLLTSDPLFLNMYQTRSPNVPCILFLGGDHISTWSSILELKADYDYYSRRRNRPIKLRPKFHLPPHDSKMIKPIDSCNGFICWLNGAMYEKDHSVYINNPLLGEYFKLRLPEWKKGVCRADYGFCFSKASGQYKVLRLETTKFGNVLVSELEVYTLGVDEIWRNVGEAPHPFYGSLGNVNVNGVLHWMDGEKSRNVSRIYSFIIETEEVKTLPAPPGLETPSWYLWLAEFGNCLCLTDSSSSQHVDIWWMKEYGVAESWIKDRIQDNGIPRNIHCKTLKPIIMWKDGEILMQTYSDYTPLISYNLKENKFRKVKVYGNGNAQTIYIPSFYSLKTIMGDNFQVSNVYPNTEIV